MPTAADLRQELQRQAPTLWAQLDEKVGEWIRPTLSRLEAGASSGYPKNGNSNEVLDCRPSVAIRMISMVHSIHLMNGTSRQMRSHIALAQF